MTNNDFFELVAYLLENVSDCDFLDLVSEYEKFLKDLKLKERQEWFAFPLILFWLFFISVNANYR